MVVVGHSSLQLKPHLLVLALEVLIFLFSNNLALHHSIHQGLTHLQLLESLKMLLLELPQILLKDEIVLLELNVLDLQAIELLKKPGKPGLGAVSGYGSLGGFALHHRGKPAKIEKLFILRSQTLLELGVLLLKLAFSSLASTSSFFKP